jgi:hypothetical protein
MLVVSILEWLFRMLLEVFKPEIQRELHTISLTTGIFGLGL